MEDERIGRTLASEYDYNDAKSVTDSIKFNVVNSPKSNKLNKEALASLKGSNLSNGSRSRVDAGSLMKSSIKSFISRTREKTILKIQKDEEKNKILEDNEEEE
jgi:hypothetical protein